VDLELRIGGAQSIPVGVREVVNPDGPKAGRAQPAEISLA